MKLREKYMSGRSFPPFFFLNRTIWFVIRSSFNHSSMTTVLRTKVSISNNKEFTNYYLTSLHSTFNIYGDYQFKSVIKFVSSFPSNEDFSWRRFPTRVNWYFIRSTRCFWTETFEYDNFQTQSQPFYLEDKP